MIERRNEILELSSMMTSNVTVDEYDLILSDHMIIISIKLTNMIMIMVFVLLLARGANLYV